MGLGQRALLYVAPVTLRHSCLPSTVWALYYPGSNLYLPGRPRDASLVVLPSYKKVRVPNTSSLLLLVRTNSAASRHLTPTKLVRPAAVHGCGRLFRGLYGGYLGQPLGLAHSTNAGKPGVGMFQRAPGATTRALPRGAGFWFIARNGATRPRPCQSSI